MKKVKVEIEVEIEDDDLGFAVVPTGNSEVLNESRYAVSLLQAPAGSGKPVLKPIGRLGSGTLCSALMIWSRRSRAARMRAWPCQREIKDCIGPIKKPR